MDNSLELTKKIDELRGKVNLTNDYMVFEPNSFLAGSPLNIPIFNKKGNGDAYHSWKSDHRIAIDATTFKWIPLSFLVGDKSSSILVWIFLSKRSVIT